MHVPPNLIDYESACTDFSWEKARMLLDGLPEGGGVNIAHEAVDRFVSRGHAHRTALRWLGCGGVVRDIHYADMMRLSNRFANALDRLGVGSGDRVATLVNGVPAFHVAALGTLKNRAVFCPLPVACGSGRIEQCLTLGAVKVLVVTLPLYEEKNIRELRSKLPALEHVIVVGDAQAPQGPAGTLGFLDLMENASEHFTIPATEPDDPAFLFYEDATGTLDAAVQVHDAAVMHCLSGRLALDLREGDVFWPTLDPAWAAGICHGMLAALMNGATLVVDEAEFDVERCWQILERERVDVWYTAPTKIGRLIEAGPELASARDLHQLRLAGSAGGTLPPEALLWAENVLGQPFHDSWWQTETGVIVLANYRALEVRPGSAGRPLPGIHAAIVRRGSDGTVVPVQDGEPGELAIRAGWPSMFRGYLGSSDRYADCFAGGWYLSGEVARKDRDGSYSFVRRTDAD
jgi:acetyl-CoA synthetase